MKKSRNLLSLLLSVSMILILSVSALAAETEKKIGIGIVDSDGLRLREDSSTDSDVITTAFQGDHVVVIRQVGNWYLVDYNLNVGYMSADHIEFKDRENVELGYGEVNISAVNLRSTPTSDGELLQQMPYGASANIIGFNCGWYKVQYNGDVGYIRSDLLSLTEKPLFNMTSVPYSNVANQLISNAQTFLGTPYVWGGTKPSGFDCSGFTQYVYKQAGYSLNRTASQQLNNGYAVTNLEIGDLLFWENTYSGAGAASHCGIYMGNDQFIHAASGGVKITSIHDSFYSSRYVGARRIL